MFSPFSFASNNLQMIRNGWFRPNFELTDGKETYGELTYSTFFRRKASIKTALASWIFQQKFFSRTIAVTNEKGVTVGELGLKWFSRSAKLHLEKGQVFTFTRPVFWKRQYFWLNNQQEQVAEIRPKFFSKTMDIVLEKNLQSDTLPLLLAFLGTHLIVLRRRRRAAAAAH